MLAVTDGQTHRRASSGERWQRVDCPLELCPRFAGELHHFRRFACDTQHDFRVDGRHHGARPGVRQRDIARQEKADGLVVLERLIGEVGVAGTEDLVCSTVDIESWPSTWLRHRSRSERRTLHLRGADRISASASLHRKGRRLRSFHSHSRASPPPILGCRLVLVCQPRSPRGPSTPGGRPVPRSWENDRQPLVVPVDDAAIDLGHLLETEVGERVHRLPERLSDRQYTT